MDPWLFALIFLSLFGGIALIMFYKFHKGFGTIFFFQGAIYVSISVGESSMWDPFDGYFCYGSKLWMWAFWGLLIMFVVPIAFLTMFIYAQSQRPDYKVFGKKESIEASLVLMLIVGNYGTFGAFVDFGCYIIWGLDRFYEYAVIFHGSRFFLGIPTLYWIKLPFGLVLQILSLWLIRKYNKKYG
ncbi:MAG: hypothetical protein HWN65_01530 [Candidatus Helarchaeota archaeon]|nr:hypothetical protein [Candidatus Helarchaeota archaeon]